MVITNHQYYLKLNSILDLHLLMGSLSYWKEAHKMLRLLTLSQLKKA